ncbi:MAG: hypothetical protein GF332_00610 [Candidatus Moranbacteria bacterium]|nr:hypothetical protein [Candidatus Moranbacteria bacterium]
MQLNKTSQNILVALLIIAVIATFVFATYKYQKDGEKQAEINATQWFGLNYHPNNPRKFREAVLRSGYTYEQLVKQYNKENPKDKKDPDEIRQWMSTNITDEEIRDLFGEVKTESYGHEFDNQGQIKIGIGVGIEGVE